MLAEGMCTGFRSRQCTVFVRLVVIGDLTCKSSNSQMVSDTVLEKEYVPPSSLLSYG